MKTSSFKKTTGAGVRAILEGMQATIRILRWGILALSLVYFLSGFTIVGPNECAVILRFGRLLPGIHASGLLPGFPVPVDEIIKIPINQIQEMSLLGCAAPPGMPLAADPMSMAAGLHPARDGYMLTGDVNIIQSRFSARFKASDPVAYALSVRDRDSLLGASLYQAALLAAAQTDVDTVLSKGIDQYRQNARRLAQARVDALGLGIEILSFDVQEMIPPRQVLNAFQSVISAQIEIRTLLDEAQSYRNSELPPAEAMAYRIRAETDSRAQDLRAKAKGEAAAFLSLSKQAAQQPEVTRTRLYYETVEALMPALKTGIVTAGNQDELRVLVQPGQKTSSTP
ncbi:MAG: protease modulator HflK [Verrucomicrobiae bacterium]|nr:protease modulator HflK [Verrucomicrobiae bacterium]